MSLTVPEASVDAEAATVRPETLHSLPHGSSAQASANAGVDRPRPRPAGVPVNASLRAVVFVSRVDDELDRVMRYLAFLGTDSVRAVHLGDTDAALGAQFWARYGRALEFVPPRNGIGGRRRAVHHARAIVRAEQAAEPDGLLAVVVPASRDGRGLVRRASDRRVRAGMLNESGVLILNLP